MDQLEEIKTLKSKCSELMERRIRLQASLDALKKKREEILQQLTQMGLENVNLSEYLNEAAKKIAEVKQSINQLEQKISKSL